MLCFRIEHSSKHIQPNQKISFSYYSYRLVSVIPNHSLVLVQINRIIMFQKVFFFFEIVLESQPTSNYDRKFRVKQNRVPCIWLVKKQSTKISHKNLFTFFPLFFAVSISKNQFTKEYYFLHVIAIHLCINLVLLIKRIIKFSKTSLSVLYNQLVPSLS